MEQHDGQAELSRQTISRPSGVSLDWRVENRICLPMAEVLQLQVESAAPIDTIVRDETAYWVFHHGRPCLPDPQFCLTEHWRPQRFEPVGKMFLLPPKHEARLKSAAGKQRTIACKLETKMFQQFYDRDINWTGDRLEKIADISNPVMGTLIALLGDELIRPGFASEIMLETFVRQIAVHLVREFEGEEESERAGLEAWRLRAIDERLENVRTAPTLSELADICRISVRHLSRGFRASRGVSIGSFVSNRRVERAKQLLMQGKGVKVVANALGFASAASFCNVFRRATGFAPGEFKQRFS